MSWLQTAKGWVANKPPQNQYHQLIVNNWNNWTNSTSTIGTSTGTWTTCPTTTSSTNAVFTVNPNINSYNQTYTMRQPASPAPAGFNKYVNASDLMNEFIEWLGAQGVRKREIMALPMELFVKWLIVRACEEDGEEPIVKVELPAKAIGRKRCIICRKFMKDKVPVELHRECSHKYFDSIELIERVT